MENTKYKCEKAKKKLKAHLEKYKEDDGFIATELKAQYWWNVINKAAFKNQLPPPDFEIRRLRGSWGICFTEKGKKVLITINDAITSRELFIATIAHEMVHQWQHETDGCLNHSTTYIKWKKYFKKHYNIIL